MHNAIEVELFGIPRSRAGVAKTTAQGERLGEVLGDLEARFPGLAESCIEGGQLKPGYVCNVGGQRFVTDPQLPLAAGDVVLLLSADAGG
ncbi:MAG: molybdopterin synthase sulfur carrier subunit [Planctomycetota bacterium]|nr:MAG: molybdopterin synthase sulfur carrier subunit [Planctomycetota bacterium]REJ97584.1 MAG: molybdopterin synthase sulfur carrier subunit [Planctomycetota bacterium]REK23006.1 MAG: molybdopterin synthase sulfur carrier subunit [Planctomycetota bacterium]REK43369.1 MAG: molybdopterin synthase sulfur carrier subunit [Planctomycetota bacterium]